MTTTLKSMKLTVLAGLFAALLPLAQAQQAEQPVAFDRAGVIRQIAGKWGSSAGPTEQFQATLNAAGDGALAQLLSATSIQLVRAILLGNLASQSGGNGVMALGDSTQDLVFTPNNPPCRVFDTRFIGAGTAPAAASTSSYQVYGNAATISAQGGNAAGCAAPKGEPVAVSANFTAVPVGFQGHIRVFPFGGALPTVSFVNFNGVVGNNIANSGIVSTCYLCASDLSVYNGSQTHHIGDVMGYFYPATFGNIDLPNSTLSTGNILKNGARFIHNYGSQNTFIGEQAGNFTMSGAANTASGTSALIGNSAGNYNTADGAFALFSNTNGSENTAGGFQALASNTTGSRNTASGTSALFSNTTGNENTASGYLSLVSNTTGTQNTATGRSALGQNTTGDFNTAHGAQALKSNTTGFKNTASGLSALYNNTIGGFNTASGVDALVSNTAGSNNTATGWAALNGNTTGENNTATGWAALYGNSTGNHNTAVGYGAGVNHSTGSGNLYFGHEGVGVESNTIRIGSGGLYYPAPTRFFAGGIRGVTTGNVNAIPVLVDSAGQLGTISSSRSVKQDIADMADASDVLMNLRPVTFRYKAHADDATVQYGLIAEEVDQVAPGLVAHSADGAAETVYYQHLAPMLVNEYQKQQRTIQVQAGRIAELEQQAAEMAKQKERITELEQHTAEIAVLKRQVAEIGELRQQTARMAELLERLGRVEVVDRR